MHPAEGRQRSVTGHADRSAVSLGIQFALPDDSDDFEQRPEGVGEGSHHTYYK